MISLSQFIKEAMEQTENSVGGKVLRFIKADFDGQSMADIAQDDFIDKMASDIAKAKEDVKLAVKSNFNKGSRIKLQKAWMDASTKRAEKYADEKYKRQSYKDKYKKDQKEADIAKAKERGQKSKQWSLGEVERIMVKTSKADMGTTQLNVDSAPAKIYDMWKDNKDIVGYDICAPNLAISFTLYVYPVLNEEGKKRDEEAYQSLCAAMDKIYGKSGAYTGD